MRRGGGGGIYGPKPRAKQIDEFIHHVAVEGAPDPVAAAQRLRALGPLSPAEKRRIEQGTRRQSTKAQAKVSHRMGQAFSAVTLPLTGQTAAETRRVVAKNLSRGNQGDPRRLDVGKQEMSIGMAAWVPGGNPLRRAGARVWNNGRLVEKAERTVEEAAKKTPKTPEQKLAGSMSSARTLRKKQEVLRSQERARRAEALDKALLSQPGEAGRQAALAELKGELPKLQFGALARHNITNEDVHRFEQTIRTHPELRPYDKLNAEKALHRVLRGQVPTKADVKWIRRVFGDAKADEVEQHVTNWKRLAESGINLINVPRALKSAYDISAPFRQGLVVFAGHPVLASRNLRPMIRALRKEGAYEDLMQEIGNRPNFELYQRGKLALTDTENLVTREEAFIGANYAEKIPVAGRGVRASGRAYAGFLNKTRADLFDYMVEAARKQGIDVENEKFLRKTAGFVNTATGRGNLGHFEEGLKYANALFFSPRLIASRLNLLFNPTMYVGRGVEGRVARQEARRAMASLLGTGSLVLWLAKQNGAEVGMDPRSSDFGKIKLGDTRIDIWGGFQQYIVAADRILKGERVNSSTGEVTDIISEREGVDNLLARGWDVTKDLAQNKYAPVPGYVNAYRKGRTFEGTDFNPYTEGAKLFAPLGFENAYDTLRQEGPGPAAVGLGLGSIGFGVQTYRNTGSKKKESRGGGGGGGIYGSRSRSGGGGGIYGR